MPQTIDIPARAFVLYYAADDKNITGKTAFEWQELNNFRKDLNTELSAIGYEVNLKYASVAEDGGDLEIWEDFLQNHQNEIEEKNNTIIIKDKTRLIPSDYTKQFLRFDGMLLGKDRKTVAEMFSQVKQSFYATAPATDN